VKQPTFDTPQWRFYGAKEYRDYYVCDGAVAVSPEHGEDYAVPVAVPVEFVKFLHDIGHHERVTLFLDQMQKRWVFGYYWMGEDEELHVVDLWHYSASSFPFWARRD
jgi:hypothetical protein